MKKRAVRAASITGAVLFIGLVFAYGAAHWGWWLPCIFNQVTGLLCPGCGISRMCLAILKLDFAGAFQWNPAVFLMLPFIGYLLGYMMYRHIRFDDVVMRKWQQILAWILVGILLIFAIVRNLQ